MIFSTIKGRRYRLSKARSILSWFYGWYKKKSHTLSASQRTDIEQTMEELDRALLSQDRNTANELARKLEIFGNAHIKRSFLSQAFELLLALILAFAVAALIRQMWFEFYEIPTGSMRPTFREQDHLTVTKTTFGLNVPLATEHFYFDPSLVQRGGVVTFSADGLPMQDADTTYFGIFPYKKRLIKRMIAKPGDTVYFYGGKVYVMDETGHFVEELVNNPWMKNLEYLPFMSFEGEPSSSRANEMLFSLMNLPIGKLALTPSGDIKGYVYNGKEWVVDNPAALNKGHQSIQTYSDLWGIRNFAMARLLTKQQLRDVDGINPDDYAPADLYLELRHTPSFTYPKPILTQDAGGLSLSLSPQVSIIPLQKSHLEALMQNMYTARFDVKDGRGRRYSVTPIPYNSLSPSFAKVPDGTYEFYYGKAYRIGWGAITHELSEDFPLYKSSPQNIQKLFNLGIEVNTLFEPRSFNQRLIPHRYAYFRDGALYLLGAPIFAKDDPVLKSFLERERQKEAQSTPQRPYTAFKDYGPPLKEGKLDQAFMQAFGLKIPAKQYLLLGDNHAMSSDCRVFGFVPEANLQGAPSLILWPPGSRWGFPDQQPYPILNLPRLIIWTLAALLLLSWWLYRRWRAKRPIFIKQSTTTYSQRRSS